MWFRRDKTPPTEEVKVKGDLGVCAPCVDAVYAGSTFICAMCELEKLKKRVEELEQVALKKDRIDE